MKEKIWGWTIIHRPMICILTFFGVTIGYLLVGGEFGGRILFAAFIGALTSAAPDIMNDVIDAKIDAIDKPWRPMPRGLITPKQAWTVIVVYYVFTTIAAAFINWMFFGVIVFTHMFAAHYNISGKYRTWAGTIEQPLSASLIMYAGGLVAGDYTTLIPLLVLVFLVELGHTLLFHVEDVDVDHIMGKTSVYVLGIEGSYMVVHSCYMISAVIVMTEWFYGGFGPVYRLASLGWVFTMFTVSYIPLLRKDDFKRVMRRWNRIIGRFAILAYLIFLLIEVIV